MGEELSRREAVAALGALGGVGLAALPGLAQPPGRNPYPTEPINPGTPSLSPLAPEQLGWDAGRREFVLPELPYKPEALEPHIDKETMTIHREKHHAAYVKGANTALRRLAEIRDNQGDVSLTRHWARELAFHVSGHMNHCYFWAGMAPTSQGGGTQPSIGGVAPELAQAILRDFGSFEKFAGQFKQTAIQVQGSGWAWLVLHRDTDLLIVMQAENQQEMAVGGFMPLLGLDVWEHAYYLKYKWDRAAYVDAYFKVISWARIGSIYQKARSR
ncbi:MAG: superoxide dismutase [Phycisphaerales bacterium]